MTGPTNAVAAEPPKGLSERSRTLWRAVVKASTPLSRQASIESALRSLDTADAAANIVAEQGMVSINRDTNVPHCHPACKIEKDARAAFFREWNSLGLTLKSIAERNGV